jgi:LytS/YehU family sensor histidine kinase
VNIDRNTTKLENANLKTKSAEAANLLLKQQIQPHFLFNSLSTLKVLYKQDISLGENYLVLLADFMRTSISESHSISATLQEELKTLENYLNMQKMRFGEALQWNIFIEDEDFLHKQIPAFSLQPLAENAIKHNQFSVKNPLLIKVEQRDNTLVIANSINKKTYLDDSIGTGLNNISERYYIWSGIELEIEDSGREFLVRFQLK